jgi:hypothetical protein
MLGSKVALFRTWLRSKIRLLKIAFNFIPAEFFVWKKELAQFQDEEICPDFSNIMTGEWNCCQSHVITWDIKIPKYVEYHGEKVEWELNFAIENSLRIYREGKSNENLAVECDMHRDFSKLTTKSQTETVVKIFYDNPREQVYMPERLEAQKNLDNSMSVVIHGDILKKRTQQLLNILSESDFCAHFNPIVSQSLSTEEVQRTMVWPALPYPESILSRYYTDKVREKGVLFSGNFYRSRDAYAWFCERAKVPTFRLIDPERVGSSVIVNYLEYVEEISKYELMFANGYKYHDESILVGKVIEAILVGTTVLYESGSWIDTFLTPYKHYVPVRSARDLIVKAEYLLNNPKVSRSIAANAFNFYVTQYPSGKFWNEMESALIMNRIRSNLVESS